MQTFYVDPVQGSDSRDGLSPATAFKTVGKAKQSVATFAANMTGDILVYLRGGLHRQTATLVFGPADSGTNGYRVIYKNYENEAPVLSGGAGLSSGWTLHDAVKNIYKKTGVTATFRQLYINGKTGIRARHPNREDGDSFGPYYSMIGIDATAKTAKINAWEIAAWSGLNEVEMVMNPHWYHYRGRISSYTVSGGQATVTFQPNESTRLFDKGNGFWPEAPYFFENSLDFLDAEGEWFLDTTGDVLYYKPLAGDDLATATVEAPSLEVIVRVEGTATNKARNLRFEGLEFTHSNWNRASLNGAAMTQGARDFLNGTRPGAITVQYAENVDIVSCSFRFLGLNGVSFVRGVSHSTILNNDFRWIAANGVVIHDAATANPLPEDLCDNIKVLNNSITRYGQHYTNGIGVISYFVTRLLVADNEIAFAPYMGVQVGGQAGGTGRNVGMWDNIVRQNYIHHVMQLHDDGGGVYTLGRQPGTLVADNFIHNLRLSIWTGTNPAAGLYADNYSEYLTFERNATVNCSSAIKEQTSAELDAINNHFIGNVTTADPAIAQYSGNKDNYILPAKNEAESLSVTGGALETDTAYSNGQGVRTSTGLGILGRTFTGADGLYAINTAYLTGSADAASYRLKINGTQVDAWTALLFTAGLNSPPLQIRHRLSRGLALKSGDTVTLELTPGTGGTPARVDYLEIYAQQTIRPVTTPTGLRGEALSGTQIRLSWDAPEEALTYTLQRAASLSGPFTTLASGLTATTWTDTNLLEGQTYYYRLTAADFVRSSLPSEAVAATTLAIIVTPRITQQPVTQLVAFGGSASFTVTAVGLAVSYQWRKDGQPIPAANSASYTVPSVQAADVGLYDVIITNSAGSITSSSASLSALNPAATVKANNTSTLNQTASWTGGTTPGVFDTATWTGTYTSGTVGVGSGLTVGRIQLASPSTAITLSSGTGPLILGGGGFDLSTSTQNLTVNTPLTLAAHQTWAIASGRTLTVASAISEPGGARSLTLTGNGTTVFSGNNTFTGPLLVSPPADGLPTYKFGGNNPSTIARLTGGSFPAPITVNGRLDLTAPITSLGLLSGSGATGLISNSATTAQTLTFAGGSSFSMFQVGADNARATLRQSGPGGVAFSFFGYNTAAPNSAHTFDGGIWTLGQIGQNNTGAQASGTFTLTNGADVTVSANGTFAHGTWRILNGALRFNTGISLLHGSATGTNTSLVFQVNNSGGGPALLTAAGGFTLADGGSMVNANSLTIGEGGTVMLNGGLTLGSISVRTAETDTVHLQGGKLVLSGTLSAAATTTGQTRTFNWTGGQLSAATVTASAGFVTPASGGLTPTALLQTAGTLAPGDLGTPGRTVINGNYSLGVAATLDLDLGGTTAATTFQGTATQFDNLTVSGTTSLAGDLSVALLPGYAPPNSATFTILSSTGTLSGTFANIPFGSRLPTADYEGSFIVTKSGNDIVLSAYLPYTAIESWRLQHFGTSANSGTAADTADTDRDGASNILEYALGTSPTSAASSATPVVSLLPAPNSTLALSFLRARADLTYHVEASSTLASGSWTVLATNPGTVGQTVTVTDTVPVASATPPRRFLRLRVTAP